MSFTSGRALIVGVGSYAKLPASNVPVTVGDARAVATLLQSAAAGYPAGQVTLLHDDKATRPALRAALAALADAAAPSDTVLIFYAGHGEFGTDGHYYLTTHETEAAGGKVVPGTALRDDELLQALQAIRAERLIVVFNACHSGAAAPQSLSLAAATPPAATAAAILGTGTGRVLLTACAAEQRSYFDLGAPRTIFADALLRALRGEGVPSRAGGISVYDLYPAVYAAVSELALRLFGRTQQPQLTIQQGQGPLILALHPGGPAGSMGLDDGPPTGAGVHVVSAEQSQAALSQVMQGSHNAHIATLHNEGAQGTVINPSAPVTQTFGPQRTINTGGGDYAEGNIDKRQGAFVSGGTIYGPVVGVNSGTITAQYGAAPRTLDPLGQAIALAQQLQASAQQRGQATLSRGSPGGEQRSPGGAERQRAARAAPQKAGPGPQRPPGPRPKLPRGSAAAQSAGWPIVAPHLAS